VLRWLLAADAEVPLLLAARDAAFRALRRIMEAEHRPGLGDNTAWLLGLGRLSAIGRIAMLDNWRGHLLGRPIVFRPYGENTDYARAMRLDPKRLELVIAIVEGRSIFTEEEIAQIERPIDPVAERVLHR
jgi:hypothetical protein